MKKKYERILILYSGGADSRLLLEFANLSKKDPYCLLIDYNQLHKEELEFAKKQLKEKDISFNVVKVDGLNLTSGLTGDGTQGRFGEDVSIWHVPGRNTMFLGLALSIAENLGIGEIWYGADWSDREGLFPDCMQEYVYRMNEVFQIAGPSPVKVRAPLLGFDKNTILTMLNSFGVKESEIFSGYGTIVESGE